MSERMSDTINEDGIREVLQAALMLRGSLTREEAWQIGHRAEFYTGGEGREVDKVLNSIGRRHDGFWRAITPQDRDAAKRWADYWTPKRGQS
jgi:hypothetical protein